ncbi:MAG: YIP1 family protein [Dethiobacter sp.]|jgi:hypothetical protein|nr:YIP1 family protein [Dethiobacter sp.]MBS3900941.1 YIP1 family protein [Dethiobacter sp.]
MEIESKDEVTRRDGLAEVVVGIISSPVATIREVSKEPSLRLSFTAFILVMMVVSMTTALTDVELTAQLGGSAVVFAVLMPFSLLILVVQAGVSFGAARLLGARGSFHNLLSLFALSNLPSLFMAPLALLRFAPGIAGSILHGLGSFILSVWVLVLAVIAVRETFQVTTGRALLICYLPILLLVVLVALLAGLALLLYI